MAGEESELAKMARTAAVEREKLIAANHARTVADTARKQAVRERAQRLLDEFVEIVTEAGRPAPVDIIRTGTVYARDQLTLQQVEALETTDPRRWAAQSAAGDVKRKAYGAGRNPPPFYTVVDFSFSYKTREVVAQGWLVDSHQDPDDLEPSTQHVTTDGRLMSNGRPAGDPSYLKAEWLTEFLVRAGLA